VCNNSKKIKGRVFWILKNVKNVKKTQVILETIQPHSGVSQQLLNGTSAHYRLFSYEKLVNDNNNKKLSYRRGTARCVVSIEILPIATQQCRNYLYDKS